MPTIFKLQIGTTNHNKFSKESNFLCVILDIINVETYNLHFVGVLF